MRIRLKLEVLYDSVEGPEERARLELHLKKSLEHEISRGLLCTPDGPEVVQGYALEVVDADSGRVGLSARIRLNSESAPWVVDAVKVMEDDLVTAQKRIEQLEAMMSGCGCLIDSVFR
jgi:hypothetical protein